MWNYPPGFLCSAPALPLGFDPGKTRPSRLCLWDLWRSTTWALGILTWFGPACLSNLVFPWELSGYFWEHRCDHVSLLFKTLHKVPFVLYKLNLFYSFGHEACGGLSFLTRYRTHVPCIESAVLTTALPGEHLFSINLKKSSLPQASRTGRFWVPVTA